MSALQDINISPDFLHNLPAKKRLDFIINHEAPRKVVRAMKTPDLLLIIREVGAESSLELVEMMHPTQIQELLDFEAWSNDQLNPRALGHYFSLFFEANADVAVSQIYHLDMELIGVMFKMTSTIYDLSAGEEPFEYSELFSTSPDGRFLVCFADDAEHSLAHMLHTFLERLYGRDLEFALRLLESLRFELISALEEQSLRWRDNRLLDFGILPREERLQFFSPLSKQEINKLMHHADAHADNVMMPMSLIKSSELDAYPFLKTALQACTDEQKSRFWQALVHATANMHASLSGDFGDVDAMSKTAHYVKLLVEVGLFQSSNAKLADAAHALMQHSVKFLIRLGRSALTNMRKLLTSRLGSTDHLLGDDYCHLDSPLREVAQALTLGEPRFYEGLVSAKKLTVRYFENLSELNITLAAVNEILFRARFIACGLGFKQDALIGKTHLSHANIFARTVVNAFLSRETPLSEIAVHDLSSIFVGSDLSSSFVAFVDAMVASWVATVANERDDGHEMLLEKAHNFKSAVLIQLSQNPALSIG